MNMSRRTIILDEVKKLGLDPNKNHDLKKIMQVKRAGGVKRDVPSVATSVDSSTIDDGDHDLDDREDVGDDVEFANEIVDVELNVEPEPIEAVQPPPVKKQRFKKVTHSE